MNLLYFPLKVNITTCIFSKKSIKSSLCPAIAFKYRAKMESTDCKRNSQMEIFRPSKRPENEFPIRQLVFAYYSQMPDRFQECLDITISISRFVIFTWLVVPEKRQNPFMVVPRRINRAYNLFISFEKIFHSHLRHKVY